jgi:4-amino-4-deoxy-L-arabinose transferase-like glycosyltransferase
MYIYQHLKDFGKDKENWLLSLLLAIAILLFFYNLWVPSIWNPNEAFYAEAARETLESKDFLTPHFNYEPRFQKPILLYWFVSATYLLFGINEFTTRLVSAILALATVFVTFLIGKLVWNRRAGLLSAVVLATSFEFNQAARYTSPEMTLLFFITLSLYAFLKGITESNKYWLYIGYICMGLATLTKGPVGFILPMLIITVFLILTKDWNVLSKIKLHYGIIIITLIAAPWFLYMIYTYGQQYISVIWGENVKRFMGEHSKSSTLFYYFLVLPWNFLPWFPFLIIAFASYTKDFIRKNLDKKAVFIAVWFLIVFCFFSLSKGKLPPYILPLFPAASILVGRYFDEQIEKRNQSEKLILFLSLLIVIVIIIAFVFLSSILELRPYILILGLVLLSLPTLVILKNMNPSVSFMSISSAMLVFYFLFLSFVLPTVEIKRPYRHISDIINKYDPQKKAELISYGYSPYSLSYYAHRRVHNLKNLKLVEIQKSSTPMILMLKESDYIQLDDRVKDSCKTIYQFQLYTKSESRFLKFILSLKSGRDFDTFLLLVCDSE